MKRLVYMGQVDPSDLRDAGYPALFGQLTMTVLGILGVNPPLSPNRIR